MSRPIIALFSMLLVGGAVCARAQVVPSATARQTSVTAGGMVSVFQPDFAGEPTFQGLPLAQSSNNALIGVGAYVDVRLKRWLQLEAEGRWLRFNQYENIHQDNYLVGPRLPVYHFWKSTVYGKVLVGFSEMNFGSTNLGSSFGNEHGRYTDIAFGGGMDVKLTRKLSLRVPDVEYQYWPTWNNSTLSPYGVSVGVGYKIF